MSEINQGIPEGVTQKATIINFEAAKGKRSGEKNRQAEWLRERGKRSTVKPVDGNTPANTNDFDKLETKPRLEKQGEIIPPEPQTGEVQSPAENTNTIIDFQTARENRLVNQPDESPVTTENTADIPSFLKPASFDADENIVIDYLNSQENSTDDFDDYEDEDNPENTIESDDVKRNKEQLKAMGVIGIKLEQFDVPVDKRDEIFESLADDPDAVVKVTGVIRNFHPQNSIEILENIAYFRKRIDQAIEKKLAEGNEEAERELSGFELLLLILGSLLKGSVVAVAGDELEQIGLKEKEEKSA
jgi:hypothetical protein